MDDSNIRPYGLYHCHRFLCKRILDPYKIIIGIDQVADHKPFTGMKPTPQLAALSAEITV